MLIIFVALATGVTESEGVVFVFTIDGRKVRWAPRIWPTAFIIEMNLVCVEFKRPGAPKTGANLAKHIVSERTTLKQILNALVSAIPGGAWEWTNPPSRKILFSRGGRGNHQSR